MSSSARAKAHAALATFGCVCFRRSRSSFISAAVPAVHIMFPNFQTKTISWFSWRRWAHSSACPQNYLPEANQKVWISVRFCGCVSRRILDQILTIMLPHPSSFVLETLRPTDVMPSITPRMIHRKSRRRRYGNKIQGWNPLTRCVNFAVVRFHDYIY